VLVGVVFVVDMIGQPIERLRKAKHCFSGPVNCMRDAALLASLAWARRCFTRRLVASLPDPCTIPVSLALGHYHRRQFCSSCNEVASLV
jgi:hypothetical protein